MSVCNGWWSNRWHLVWMSECDSVRVIWVAVRLERHYAIAGSFTINFHVLFVFSTLRASWRIQLGVTRLHGHLLNRNTGDEYCFSVYIGCWPKRCEWIGMFGELEARSTGICFRFNLFFRHVISLRNTVSFSWAAWWGPQRGYLQGIFGGHRVTILRPC